MWLNETTEVIDNTKHHHTKHIKLCASFTASLCYFSNYANSNFPTCRFKIKTERVVRRLSVLML